MYISKNLKKLLLFSKTKKLNNVRKPNNKYYLGYLELLTITKFLDDNTSIKERLYYIEHNISKIVKCAKCKNKAYWNGRKNVQYHKYCPKCVKKSPEYKENYKNSMLEKYGVEHNWSTGELRNKDLKALIIKYGNSEEISNIDNITSGLKLNYVKNKIKFTMLEKYGVEHNWSTGELRNKDLKALIIKYGNSEEISNIDNISTLFSTQYFRDKSKSTKLERYNNEFYCNSGMSLNTSIFKYGNSAEIKDIKNINSFTQLKYFRDKSNSTKLERYNNEFYVNPTKIKESHKAISFSSIVSNFDNLNFTLLSNLEYFSKFRILKYKCNKCNSIRESYWPYIRCTKCNPYNKSIGENEVLEFCKSLVINVQSNSRSIITPLELDIYMSNDNLAIEYNGLFWHSSYSTDSENKDYHLIKTRECEKKGIQLFHIFENEWQDPIKQKIWKSIISNRLGKSERIFARKTILKPVSSTEKSEFLISNHLQGDCVSSVNLGLYMGDELVSLMTFGKSRYNKNVEWELIRFCNLLGTSVVGGASRLLKAFRKENLGSIISYADKRRSNGNLYNQFGFKFSHESGPNYFYWKPGSMALESRIGYQKHKLRDNIEVFDPKLTESENMYSNGYRKIYDCGNQVWILK